MQKLRDAIAEVLADGANPNEIEAAVESALVDLANDWAQWGDGRWRLDRVCPKCGSCYPGICGENLKPCTTKKPILRSEFTARQEAGR